jgi:hypothetical protein
MSEVLADVTGQTGLAEPDVERDDACTLDAGDRRRAVVAGPAGAVLRPQAAGDGPAMAYAWARGADLPTARRWVIAGLALSLGGALFLGSDALLATTSSPERCRSSLWVPATYWAAQWCIASWRIPERAAWVPSTTPALGREPRVDLHAGDGYVGHVGVRDSPRGLRFAPNGAADRDGAAPCAASAAG